MCVNDFPMVAEWPQNDRAMNLRVLGRHFNVLRIVSHQAMCASSLYYNKSLSGLLSYHAEHGNSLLVESYWPD